MICHRYLVNLRRVLHTSNINIRSSKQIYRVHNLGSSSRLLSTINPSQQRLDSSKREDFFVAIPEIPLETSKTNEILNFFSQGSDRIDFSKLDFEKCYLALGKTMGEFSSLIDNMTYIDPSEDILKDPRKLFESIEDGLYKLDTAYQIMYLMWHVRNEQFIALSGSDMPQRCLEIRKKIYESDQIMTIIENLSKVSKQYDRSVQKMLDMYSQESKKNGSALRIEARSEFKRMESHLMAHLKCIHDNHRRVSASFTKTIDDPDILKAVTPELSIDDSTHHKLRTPLDVNIHNCPMFIKLCPDSDTRRLFYRTLNRLCSPGSSPRYNNYASIENIRHGRQKIAANFKCRNYFELKRTDAHAKSLELIMRTLSKLNETNIAMFRKRLDELKDFASNLNEDNFDGEIGEADLEYWIHRYKQEKILGCKEIEVTRMFPYAKVFQGLQDFLKNYFDIVVDQVPSDNTYVWNKDVKVYKVSHKGDDLGTFYCDPFARSDSPSGSLIGRLRGRSNQLRCKASLYLSAGLRKSCGHETYMSQLDIQNLFRGVGKIVQELLYNDEFYELNLKGPFKADTNRILPYLFVTWLLNDPRVLQSCSFDRTSEKQLSQDYVKKILHSVTYFNSVRNSHELYKSHLDIEFNTSTKDSAKIAQNLHTIYKPFTYDTTSFHYCSDVDLHSNRAGLYYGDIWSKLIATECFKTYNVGDDVSSADYEIIRQTSDRIMASLFDLDEEDDLMDRLASITGDGFKFSQPSLGVL